MPSPAPPRAFEFAATYDCLRLDIYRQRGPRASAIAIRQLHSAHVLRFDDVAYFNTIYAPVVEPSELADFESAYTDSRHSPRLIAPHLRDRGPLADACASRGWSCKEEYAWLSGPIVAPDADAAPVLRIEGCVATAADEYFATYLRAFGAHPLVWDAAIANMRWLFTDSRLHFLLAREEDMPVGVGMLMTCGSEALLCAGAMIPTHRGQGGHEALLGARLRLASDLGCTRVHSWCLAGGRSHSNMLRAGLKTMATSHVWQRRPGVS